MAIVGALPFTLQNGTTADATQVMADFNSIKTDVNLRAAQNGANNDITSLAGLTTPLSIAQGGTSVAAAGVGAASALHLAFGIGYIFGLTLSNDATDATNDIDIAAGYAADSTDGIVMQLASAYVKKSDVTFVVGTNQGMLDTGAIGNGWYYMYLIQRSDTSVVDVLCSLSATAPTMPASYDRKRRIGAFFRTGGAIKAFKQVDDRFMWLVPAQDVLTVNPGTSAVTPTLTIPVTRIDADIVVALFDITPAALSSVLITSPDQTNSTPNYPTNATFGIPAAGAGVQEAAGGPVRVSTSNGTIRYRLEGSNADVSINIATNGWWDTRGRLS